MTQSPDVIGAHLVGSINFEDAETTMRTAAEHLGERLKRIPDGTTIPLFETHRAVSAAW